MTGFDILGYNVSFFGRILFLRSNFLLTLQESKVHVNSLFSYILLKCSNFLFPQAAHTNTHTHTAINTIFFIHTHPVGEKNKKKESTKCVRPFEQKEANITEPVNVPGSILSPQTSRRAPDEMTQNLL